jgi:hypothetical protein
MAAPILVKVQSATFKGKAIKSATNATIQIGGSGQMARGDGAVAQQIAWVEGVSATVTVEANEASITDADLLLPGNGSLVIVGFEQAKGTGASATTHTWTFTDATFDGATRGMPQDGAPTVSLPFRCVAADGTMASLYALT